jgi:signal peptidase
MGRIFRWIGNAIVVLLLIIITAAFISMVRARAHPGQIPSIFGYRFMSVLTGSMRPRIEPGDMAVIKSIPPEKINSGDIITFKTDESILVTHRVMDVIVGRDGLMFQTKGDANNVNDEKQVSEDKIIGVMVFSIPYGGYVASFIKNSPGVMFLILIPVILLTITELKAVLSESKKNDVKKEARFKDDMGKI